MCQAFSCIVDSNQTVTWKLGVDSHRELAEMAGYDDRQLGQFAKIEITPKNGNYLFPDEWIYQVDESPVPNWYGQREKELVLAAHKKWLRQLEKKLNRHPIVNPFEVKPPRKITAKHKKLLRDWDSVWDLAWASVGDSVEDSVGDSVRASVWNLPWNLVWGLVGDSVLDSVGDTVWAYSGSFFHIRKWKHIKHKSGVYPYQSCVDLWNMGLVPSFDGSVWRLHGGTKADVLFSISQKDLRKI